MIKRYPDSRVDPIEDSVDSLAELFYGNTELDPDSCKRLARRLLDLSAPDFGDED